MVMGRILPRAMASAAAMAIVYWLVSLYDTGLRDPRFLDGWLLFAGILFLLAFNIRRRMPALPLGSAAVWMQLHLYVGYFVIAVFVLHAEPAFPDNLLEQALWGLFAIAAATGGLGAYLSRTFPAKLAQRVEHISFDRIPQARAELGRRAAALASGQAEQAGSRAISDLYSGELSLFFAQPRNLVLHLRGSRQPLDHLCGQIEEMEHYVDDAGAATLRAIKELTVKKDTLDFQYAHQGILKAWLFVHVPASFALLLLTATHVALMYAFASGAP